MNNNKNSFRWKAKIPFWSLEYLVLPFVINKAIIWCGNSDEFNPFQLCLILTLISIGIPHLFGYVLHTSKLFRTALEINEIPLMGSINPSVNKMDYRNLHWGFLVYVHIIIDAVSEFIVYWVIITNVSTHLKAHLIQNYIFDFVLPYFIFELVYDFMYYWWHYYGHKNRFLWDNIHSTHHIITLPRYLDVYHMSMAETLFIRATKWTVYYVFVYFGAIKLSTIVMINCYVLLVEFLGHSGFKIYAKDVCPLKCILHHCIPGFVQDSDYHDFHHQKKARNYSKRLAIWDTVFGTMYDPKVI